jgi:L-lactate dehydrogenase complex protein LldF
MTRAALPVVDHAQAAAAFTADTARTDWHDGALWWMRQRRDAAVATVPDWEALRAHASAIKEHTLVHLATYLERFERAAQARGITVHWAQDAHEHNAIVHRLLTEAGATRLVKSKSMLTEECHLNPYLIDRGIEVVDTDLGERIVQLREEAPSHIVMPAIHLQTADVGATFHEHLGTPASLVDPVALTRAARADLRARFLAADATLTGANFAIAETGGIVVCTNEGNADLGMALAPLHIASIGIEKLIPRADDLPVFLRLLARSATGQPQTVYTSHIHGPRDGQSVHIVLVDNGRTAQLARADYWRSLKCIRCGACLNTCPVYRRSGGHSYGATIPGPIGSVLSPGVDLTRYATLPFASTLCGSCTAVCPVHVDLDAQLLAWRRDAVHAGQGTSNTRSAARVASQLLQRPGLYRRAVGAARLAQRLLPARVVARLLSGVVQRVTGGRGPRRTVAPLASQSFHEWWESRSRHE